ncbi:MAG: AtpZ/AtpI family protein [Anaerolineales bacterium]|nr:AtpZ/AtpI family protein [Anaerolineales bacterium]
MSQPEKDPKTRLPGNANLAAAGLAGQIGCVVPVIILASVLAGLWLDELFATGKLITLIFVLGSLPVSIYLTFRLAMRAVKEINQSIPPPASTSLTPPKEDETSD